jgi:uncharacterized protein YjiS (DUF1127 family)
VNSHASDAHADSSIRAFCVSGEFIMSVVVNALTSWKEAANRAATSSDRQHGWGLQFLHWCLRCSERSRQRQALAELDDHHLKDIGKTRQEAMAEAAKPFWK